MVSLVAVLALVFGVGPLVGMLTRSRITRAPALVVACIAHALRIMLQEVVWAVDV